MDLLKFLTNTQPQMTCKETVCTPYLGTLAAQVEA